MAPSSTTTTVPSPTRRSRLQRHRQLHLHDHGRRRRTPRPRPSRSATFTRTRCRLGEALRLRWMTKVFRTASPAAHSADDLPGEAITASGNLPHDDNTDGKAASDPINFAPMHGQLGTVRQSSPSFTYGTAKHTLTDNVRHAREQSLRSRWTVVRDKGNGDYVFTLLKPVQHSVGDNENEDHRQPDLPGQGRHAAFRRHGYRHADHHHR